MNTIWSENVQGIMTLYLSRRLRFNVKSALHDRTMDAMLEPMTHALGRLLADGSIKSRLDVDTECLARVLLNAIP